MSSRRGAWRVSSSSVGALIAPLLIAVLIGQSVIAAGAAWGAGAAAARRHQPAPCRLRVSTPYDAAHPLRERLALALDPTGTRYVASAPFRSIVVRDNRRRERSWTLRASATALTGGTGGQRAAINAQNVGLVRLSARRLTGGFDTSRRNLRLYSTPAADPPVPSRAAGRRGLSGRGGHTIAHARHGRGTVRLTGTLQLTAPTSTPPGDYIGRLVFRVGCGRAVVPIRPPHHHRRKHKHKHRHGRPRGHRPRPGHRPGTSPASGPTPSPTTTVLGRHLTRPPGVGPTGNDRGSTPFTGLPAVRIAVAALLLLALGWLLLRVTRRQTGRHRA